MGMGVADGLQPTQGVELVALGSCCADAGAVEFHASMEPLEDIPLRPARAAALAGDTLGTRDWLLSTKTTFSRSARTSMRPATAARQALSSSSLALSKMWARRALSASDSMQESLQQLLK